MSLWLGFAAAAASSPVDVFSHGELGFLCWRVPAVVLAEKSGVLFAFAEARNYSGDGCVIAGEPQVVSGPRSIGMKTSPDGGQTWAAPRIVDWDGINPAVVYDAAADLVVVHYPCQGHYNGCGKAGEFATSQITCAGDGSSCSAREPLGAFLFSDGAPPLYSKGPLGISAGPGLGTQISDGPLAGRLLFAGHHGQADVTWYSDDHAKTWTLSKTIFGNLTSWGCGRIPGCFDEPFVLALPDGRVQINMRNDSLTPDPRNQSLVGCSRHPRSVADSLDGGATFGSWRQQFDLLEGPDGCQGSGLVVARAGGGPDVVLYSGPAGACMNRTRLTVHRSVDGGASYPEQLEINAGPGGYSTLLRTPGGGVAIAFERGAAAGDAACGGGGCRISIAPVSGAFVENGTSSRPGLYFGYWDYPNNTLVPPSAPTDARHAAASADEHTNLAWVQALADVPPKAPGKSFLVNVSAIFFTTLPDGTGVGRPALRPDFATRWAAQRGPYIAAIADGRLAGLFLGDELVGRGLAPADIEKAAGAARQACSEGTIIFYNEAAHVALWDNFTIAPSLSHVSFDIYHMEPMRMGMDPFDLCTPDPSTPAWAKVIAPLQTCAAMVEAFYTRLVYPKMTERQRALLVPGAFASVHNPLCDEACYDHMCAQDAWDFFHWMQRDHRVDGMLPYHLYDKALLVPYKNEIGVLNTRLTREAYSEIGRLVVGAGSALPRSASPPGPAVQPRTLQLSFWTHDFSPSDYAGWTTYAITDNLTACSQARRERGTSCLYNLNWKLFGGGPTCNSSAGVITTTQPRPNVAAVWESLVADNALAAHFANGSVSGFFLGDELVFNGVLPQQLEDVAAMVRATFPRAFLYQNEAQRPLALGSDRCDRPLNYSVARSLDALSVDVYDLQGPTPDFVRHVVRDGVYEKHVFPRLAANQTAFVMPGAFASTNKFPRCEGNLSCFDAMCAAEAADWYAWAASDARVGGIYGWYWETPTCCHNAEIGLRDMPRCRAAWEAIGRNVTRAPPPRRAYS